MSQQFHPLVTEFIQEYQQEFLKSDYPQLFSAATMESFFEDVLLDWDDDFHDYLRDWVSDRDVLNQPNILQGIAEGVTTKEETFEELSLFLLEYIFNWFSSENLFQHLEEEE